MIRVMFVCHGNICRSPMAEFILRDMVEKDMVLRGNIHIASSATSTEEIRNGIGTPVYPPAKAELARHGLSCDGKHAVQLQKSDYDQYDYLIAMDDNNLRNMRRMLGSDHSHKIFKLLDFTDEGGNVADPWYSDRFDIAYQDIERGCRALLVFLKSKMEAFS